MAARESGSPLFDRLVSVSSLFIPRSWFLGRKARNLGTTSNRRRKLARIDILALPFSGANGIGARSAIGRGTYFIFPPQTIHRWRR
jgi:hypothetical protein